MTYRERLLELAAVYEGQSPRDVLNAQEALQMIEDVATALRRFEALLAGLQAKRRFGDRFEDQADGSWMLWSDIEALLKEAMKP